MQKNIFLACSWFSNEEKSMLEDMRHSLANNKTVDDVYYCLDNQFDGIDVTEHPEVEKDRLWQEETFLTDVDGIKNADVLCVMMVPGHEDSGAAVEMGIAYALGKPIVLVLPIKMWQTDNKDKINLMVAKSPTDVIRITDLMTYDFGHIRRGLYRFSVY